MSRETRTLLGLAGALCAIFGVFAPFASGPIASSITLLSFNGYIGAIVMASAVIGGIFATRAMFKYMLYAGIAGIVGTVVAATMFQLNLSRMQSDLSKDMAGNPFAGLAGAVTQAVHLDWGVALLGIGCALLVAAALIQPAGAEKSTDAAIDPRVGRYTAICIGVIAVVVVAFNLLGGYFIGSTTITTANQPEVSAKVASSSLSDGDKAEFSAAIARGDYDPSNKTVSQVIADQRSFEAAQKAEEERAAQLTAQAKAKRDSALKAMLQAVTVSVVSKSYQPADIDTGQIQDYINVEFALRNDSSKAIRAFKGTVTFDTLMGDKIIDTPLELDQTIPPESTASWTGSLEYNQFEESNQKLKDTDLKDMTVKWEPQSILFADGSKLSIAADGTSSDAPSTP